MKQFILNNKPGNDNKIRLDGDDFHYLVRVRRYAVGETFPALLPGGEKAQVKILTIEHGILTGECLSEPVSSSVSFDNNLPQIILFQALPKSDKMDLIVRQAVEVGISEIVPFVSEYSLVKKNVAVGQKFIRWERIIIEARQQSGSKTATSICLPKTMEELIDYWKKLKHADSTASTQSCNESEALGLLFHHQACLTACETSSQGVEQKSIHSYLNIVPKIIALAVGPEGGFSDTEVSVFLENDFKPITIGNTILRTETAALYCAAAVKTLLLERDSWELKQVKKSSV